MMVFCKVWNGVLFKRRKFLLNTKHAIVVGEIPLHNSRRPNFFFVYFWYVFQKSPLRGYRPPTHFPIINKSLCSSHTILSSSLQATTRYLPLDLYRILKLPPHTTVHHRSFPSRLNLILSIFHTHSKYVYFWYYFERWYYRIFSETIVRIPNYACNEILCLHWIFRRRGKLLTMSPKEQLRTGHVRAPLTMD